MRVENMEISWAACNMNYGSEQLLLSGMKTALVVRVSELLST